MERRSKGNARIIFSVASGNFLEMYDFAVYGFYAAFIAKVFFPAQNEFISLMQSFMAFGVGFLMRPIGAIVLGSYMDKYGRKKGLVVTLGIMALGTLTIACCPGFESIGILAPIIIVIGRLLQGFSAGAEIGGASIYLAEIAPKNLRGFYVSWQSGSQQVATVFAGALGVFLHYLMGDVIMQTWGWRIPFIVGCLVVPYIFYIRRTLDETPEFKAKIHQAPKTLGAIFKSIRENISIIVFGIMFVMMTTITFYFITSYTPTFANKVLHFTKLESFTITAIIGLSNLFWLPLSGFIGDKIGRKPILLVITFLGIISAYPMLNFLTHNISFTNLLIVELWFSFIFGAYNGAMVVSLSEIMPKNVKAMGFSFSYSIATAIFGGFTPAVSTYLIEKTNNPASPAFWLTFAAICSFIASLVIFKKGGVYEKQQKGE
ncbi:MFS transporter [Campylobacter sp. MIT 97-5078]|uniref:MFS transporter n=1 Tax=Campylobacter sp. MIT 97-5078 TaxID=1548153 RepID=UPI0005148495|nr:MFS transporter [Campylobacter sp. MIT 97-5078]KGI56490.1 citrate-proton symporter [Campylobacter sp. MIT 97-5078]TQR27990.1 MFS transporter [Campylobacter sp. MIT 97-5078]